MITFKEETSAKKPLIVTETNSERKISAVSPQYLTLIKEIENEAKIYIEKLSKIAADLKYLLLCLRNYESYAFEEFLNLNYILISYMESKKNLKFADKLKEEILSLENNSSPKEITIFEKDKKIPILSQNREYIKKILIYLCANEAFSMTFKEKILKNMSYDLRIFVFARKEDLAQKSMQSSIVYFDFIIKHCKNNSQLKYYEFFEANTLVIDSFYHFIEENRLIDFTPIEGENEEIALNTKILEFCFKQKLNSLVSLITNSKQHILLIPSIILLSFEYESYEHLKPHLNNKLLQKNLSEYLIIKEIFKLKNKTSMFLDFLHFLYAIKDVEFKPLVNKIIYDEIYFILKDAKYNKIILFQMNPLLIFIGISQILFRISQKSDNFEHLFRDLANDLLEKCKNFIDNYSDLDYLQHLVVKPDIPFEKSVMDILFENKGFFSKLFESKRLFSITKSYLDNCLLYDFSFINQENSTFFKIITENIDFKCNPLNNHSNSSKVYDFEENNTKNEKSQFNALVAVNPYLNNNIFEMVPTILKDNETYKKESKHFFQRSVFFSSVSMKVFLDFIVFLGLFIYILIFIRDYSDAIHGFSNVDTDYQHFLIFKNFTNGSNYQLILQQSLIENNTNIEELSDFINNQSTSVNENCVNFLYNSTLSLNLTKTFLPPCEQVFELLEKYNTQTENLKILFVIIMIITGDIFIRKSYQFFIMNLKILTSLDIFEIFNMIVCFVILMIYRFLHFNQINSEDFYLDQNFAEFQTRNGVLSVFFAIFLLLLWLKIIYFIKMWPKFGFLIKTVELMFKTSIIFMIVYFFNISTFCSVFYTISSDNNNFDTYFRGLRNLFGFSIGHFIYPQDNYELFQWLIYLILIVFLVISNIILLKILIASLTNLFMRLHGEIECEISYNYYILQKEYLFDETFGFLIFFPRTLNIFLLPFHILSLCFQNQEFTIFLVNIFYSFYFCVIFILYLMIDLILLPFAWIKVLGLIFVDSYYDKSEKKMLLISTKTIHFVLWFLGGLFYLLYIVMKIDLRKFIKLAYDEFVLPITNISMMQKEFHICILNYLEKCQSREEEINYEILQKKIIVKSEKLQNSIKEKQLLSENEKNARISGSFYNQILKYFEIQPKKCSLKK